MRLSIPSYKYLFYFLLQVCKLLGRRGPTVIESSCFGGVWRQNPKLEGEDDASQTYMASWWLHLVSGFRARTRYNGMLAVETAGFRVFPLLLSKCPLQQLLFHFKEGKI